MIIFHFDSSNKVKFSNISKNLVCSQVHFKIVSKLNFGLSFSSATFFQSLKCSNQEVIAQILLSIPFETIKIALYQNICVIVSL